MAILQKEKEIMAGKKSRDKGSRGEREVKELLGADFKRTGYAGVSNPDLTSDWAVISVKNKVVPISLRKALQEIILLEAQEPKLNHYVAVKVARATWLIVERIEQFREDRC